jgi:hypothetical protein
MSRGLIRESQPRRLIGGNVPCLTPGRKRNGTDPDPGDAKACLLQLALSALSSLKPCIVSRRQLVGVAEQFPQSRVVATGIPRQRSDRGRCCHRSSQDNQPRPKSWLFHRGEVTREFTAVPCEEWGREGALPKVLSEFACGKPAALDGQQPRDLSRRPTVPTCGGPHAACFQLPGDGCQPCSDLAARARAFKALQPILTAAMQQHDELESQLATFLATAPKLAKRLAHWQAANP